MSTHAVAGKLFRLLSKHQDVILNAYANHGGELGVDDDSQLAVDELIRHRLAWQPDEYSSAMLSSSLRQWLDHSLKNERLSRIDADIGGRMDSIEQSRNSYVRALQRSDGHDADVMLLHLKEQVYELTELLSENVRKLWRRIESDFDYVDSIAAKQEENQKTLELAERLIEGLNAMDLDDLQQQAGVDRELRRLFSGTLPAAIERCRKELVDALHRLREMLFRLRKLEERGRLTRSLQRLFVQRPGHNLARHAERLPLPAVAALAPPLVLAANADIDNAALEVSLVSLLVGLRKGGVADEGAEGERLLLSEEPAAIELLKTPDLKRAIRSVFVDVMRDGSPLLASATYERAADGCDAESWVYGLSGEFNAMLPEHRRRFDLHWVGKNHAVFDGNMLATDLEIRRQ